MGVGTFAVVYEIRWIENYEKFAVKVFNKNQLNENKNEKKSLLNEIRIMRSVNNPKILKLVELYEGENHIYLVM